MFKLIEYNSGLDLTEFYENALSRGYLNNSNRHIMVESLCYEDNWNVWLLEYNNQYVGAMGAHTLSLFDRPSYRICTRTCVFTDLLPINSIRTRQNIKEHQHYVAQYYIPKCIEWCPTDSDLYITSHDSEDASQRQVHTIFCPLLAESGVLTKTHELEYRGHLQTFWKLDRDIFLNQLNSYPRW